VQWSPDGKHLAYGKAGNIVLMNFDTRRQRLLLTGEPAARYGYIYWNLGWSHDSRWIAFKAQNPQTSEDELAVARMDAPEKFQVLYKTTGSLHADRRRNYSGSTARRRSRRNSFPASPLVKKSSAAPGRPTAGGSSSSAKPPPNPWHGRSPKIEQIAGTAPQGIFLHTNFSCLIAASRQRQEYL
jgi:hypothetical protein